MKIEIKDIDERTFEFAIEMIKILNQPSKNFVFYELSKQTIRSVTSINSNIVQARTSLSKADFINHMKVARKEAKETKRWIEMMVAAHLIPKTQTDSFLKENEEIIKILVTIVKNAEKNKK